MKKWYSNVAVVITVVISLMGVATSGLLFLLIPQPGEVVAIAQRRITGIKTVRLQTDVSWRGADEKITWSSDTVHNRIDPKNTKASGTLSLEAGIEQPLRFKGERSQIGDIHFLKLSELPDQVGTLHFSEFRDRWLRLEPRTIFRDVSLPIVGGGAPELSPEQRAMLSDEFRRTPFLAVTEKLSSEKLDGMPTYHYKVRPEPLYFKDYFINAEALRLGRDLTGPERLSADAYFADLTPEDGELWIGKRDFLPRRLRLRFRFDNGPRDGTLDLTLVFSEYNRPVITGNPEGEITDVSPILASLLQGIRDHLPMAKEGSANVGVAEDQGGLGALVATKTLEELDADKDGLSDSLENFYGSDRNNPDTDADGVSDGAEVSQGMNPTGVGRLFDFTGGQFD